MKVIVWYYNDSIEDEHSTLRSFHTLPRKGEAVRFRDQDWRVEDVRHRCAGERGLVGLPEIYLEEGTTGFPK